MNSLSVKGVRSRLYRNADNYLGYYEEGQPALFYDGDTLYIHILFKTEDNALHFESQLRQEAVTFNSSMKSLEISSAVSFSDYLQLGGRIYYTDYIPTESESPQDTDSLISTQFSTFDSTTDEFKFQRIEKLSIFGSKGKAESAHVMDGAHCRKFSSLNKYDKDRSNRLALSRDLHGWFDHLNTSVPLFYVKVISYSDSQVLEDRHELKLAIHALDNEAADMIFPRLKEGSCRLNEGSVQTNDPLVMYTNIYVVNPVVFQKCAEWKEKVIRKSWDVYNNMKPAVE